MITYGISANEHEAAIAVAHDDHVVFASRSERYSRLKNDPHLNALLVSEASRFGAPDQIVWYEQPLKKRLRKLWAGQYAGVLREDGERYLRRFGLKAPVKYIGHHECHAANGFYTSGFDRAAVLVIDAIGEWDTISMWRGHGPTLECIFRQQYPHSLGLLYSAFTQRIGLKPNEEEYILMGMAAYGEARYSSLIRDDFVQSFEAPDLVLKVDVHRGVQDWRRNLIDAWDIAASVQLLTEQVVLGLCRWLADATGESNLVLSGGLAMNCVANSKVAASGLFKEVWVSLDPGDAGSALGAIAASRRNPLVFDGPFLGHDIARALEVDRIVDLLVRGEVVGVANGRAEFGPRALGNRSLLIDPRSAKAKEKLSAIKRRELFRPFAPAVLARDAKKHFDLPVERSPYMQFVGTVRDPDSFPAISHVDQSARVQTVGPEHEALEQILSRFEEQTGCSMLLNTSLNVKGEPLVNTWEDAQRFASLSGVRVF